MKNNIEKLAKLLPSFVENLEKELKETYAFDDLIIEIGSRYSLFTIHCEDKVSGFTVVYGDNLNKAIKNLKKELTTKLDIKRAKEQKIKQLQMELENE